MSISGLTAVVLKAYNRFVSGYWFVPLMMCLGSVFLFLVSVKIDAAFDLRGTLNKNGIYWLNLQAEGARAFLASISGALITVLGVVFSLTLLLISHVSNQFSPRVLVNFMQHKSIKFTLGILISTFLYNVLALFSIRSSSGGSSGFVSETSLLIALLLTAVCVFSLIHFFNHIPQSIRLCNILKEIGQRFSKDIEQLSLENKVTDLSLKQGVLANEFIKNIEPQNIKANKSGYLNDVIDSNIKQLAKDTDCYIALLNYLGDYIHAGSIIALVYSESPEKIASETFKKNLNSCVIVDTEKQSRTDITYHADQMIEIAAKALSPGINDPHSANSALDWLFDGLFLLQNTNLKDVKHETQADGKVFFSKPALTQEKITKYILLKSMPYFGTDLNAAIYMFTKLNLLSQVLEDSTTKKFIASCLKQMHLTIIKNHKLEGFSEDESHDEKLLYSSRLNENYNDQFTASP